MKKQLLALTTLAALTSATASTGCATLMAGGPDRVVVQSNPPGAQVFLDQQPVGVTPIELIMDRERSAGQIRVEAPGYQPMILTKTKSVNGWFWANLCLNFGVGFVVDLITGDYKKFDDLPVMINLVPAIGAPIMGPTPIQVPVPPPPPAGGAPGSF